MIGAIGRKSCRNVLRITSRKFTGNQAIAGLVRDQSSNQNNGGHQRSNFGLRKNLAGAAILLFGSLFLGSKNRADCCGIVGVVGGPEGDDASSVLIEGLTILKNRGYDSAGIASIPYDGSELCVTKFASRDTTSDSIDLVIQHHHKHVGHTTGIGHTRWATHGGKTDENAHPHVDYKNRIALIHNGTINNAFDLKKELQAQGIKFTSETDTEVIAQLVGTYLDKGLESKDALEAALSRYLARHFILECCFHLIVIFLSASDVMVVGVLP